MGRCCGSPGLQAGVPAGSGAQRGSRRREGERRSDSRGRKMGREIRVDALGARVRERVAAKAAGGGRASASRDAARPPVGPPALEATSRDSTLSLNSHPAHLRLVPAPPITVQVPSGVYTAPVCVLILSPQVVALLPMFFSPSTHVLGPMSAF